MSAYLDRDFVAFVEQQLEDTPRMRPAALSEILTRVAATPQRRRRRWPAWTVDGLGPLSGAARFASVAVVLVALAGAFLLSGVLTMPRGDDMAPASAGQPGSASQVVGHWIGQGTCPSEGIRTSTIEVVDGVSQSRGYICHLDAEWSDARLEGAITYYSSSDDYSESNPGGPDLHLESYVIHIENDEGGWWMGPVNGVSCPYSCHDGSDILAGGVPIVFEGDGAYDGLLFVGAQSGDEEIRGFIVEGVFPPSPDTGRVE